MRRIIPISGKDSLATAIVQMEREPRDDYELFFNDVQAELPETYEWLDKVEKYLNMPIHRVGISLEQIIFEQNCIPSQRVRFCTRLAKIKPMEEWIGEDDALVYFGIRADEERPGYVGGVDNITPKYPLREEGIALNGVLQLVASRRLSPPKFFWKTMYDLVVKSLTEINEEGFRIYDETHTTKILSRLPSIVFDDLFAWRTRTNCYFCFFQRVYEWIGLLEHHPDLFNRAQEIEEQVGGTGEDRFTWIEGISLVALRNQANQIINRRVKQVTKDILRSDGKHSLVLLDALSRSGCGLFCGK